MPWAALPWMLALTIRALRAATAAAWRVRRRSSRSWCRSIGGVNATALIFAGLAPVLWILYAVVDPRGRLAARARRDRRASACSRSLTSLWWIAGLWAQGRYGLDILKYTETLQVVSVSSTPNEMLRGLGYWFFYGSDRIGPWIEPASPYTQDLWLLVVSYALPGRWRCFGAACVRWRHRAYFVLLTVVGRRGRGGREPLRRPVAARAACSRRSRSRRASGSRCAARAGRCRSSCSGSRCCSVWG